MLLALALLHFSILAAGEPGVSGGRLVVGLRGEPKTLNPVTAVDGPSREVIWRMMGDLVSIDRQSQQTVLSVAESCKPSRDGLAYTVRLRPGLRFSDGHPVTADDVLFSFDVYLDEKLGAPQRGLLIMDGKPVQVVKLDDRTVRFDLPRPYGAGDRLFDGFAILPRHLLEKSFRDGSFEKAWDLRIKADQIAGLGPFRLKQYMPGERIVLEKNPYYWKGPRLPYLDEIVFLFSSSEESQLLRFTSGETDLIWRMSAKNFAALSRDTGRYQTMDAGPSTEYNFLLLNQNNTTRVKCFNNDAFRQALSAAIDRDAIVRLVYQGRATPLATHVTPGYKLWRNEKIAPPAVSIANAKKLLTAARCGEVTFSIAVSSSSAERQQMAALIQEDLQRIGITVQVAPLEFRSLIDRVLRTFDYDAAIMGLGGGDSDPNSHLSVWQLDGPMHLWRMAKGSAPPDWEREIARLMQSQLTERSLEKRKAMYDRVQQLEHQHAPLIHLVSPNVLAAARPGLGNFKPVNLDHTVLWNADELFWRQGRK